MCSTWAWSAVEGRLGPHQAMRTRRRLTVAAVGVGCAAAVAIMLTMKGPTPPTTPPRLASNPAPAGPATPPLPYSIELLQDGRVAAVPTDAGVTVHRLERGAARFEVAPCAGSCGERPDFVVLARTVRVTVAASESVDDAGPQFEVVLETDEQGPAAVHVSVIHGQVGVRHGRSDRVLRAGDDLRVSLHDPRAGSSRRASPGRPSAGRGVVAKQDDAAALFARARRADRAGDLATARQHYEDLLKSFPNDPRAGLVAYEIGRILMDRKGDLAGAARQLERSRRNYDLAKKLRRAEVRKLELGTSDLINVNIREVQEADAAGTLIDTQASYFLALADFRAAVAAPAGGTPAALPAAFQRSTG